MSTPNSLVGVRQIPTTDLHPNPHNPRMLFDKAPMQVLRESISNVGILVPLTVYQEARTERFVILDGQRRWICAQDLGLKAVPANIVAEPTLVENIVTMFQIHKLRQDWELMPTALKVQLLMEELHEKNDRKLAVLTGLDEAVITRCKKLVSYEKEFQDMMLDAKPEKRIKADFFIELYAVIHDREVQRFPWFKRKVFVRRMLKKYLHEPRTIKSVTDFRTIKQHIANARRVGALKRFGERLQEFAEDPTIPIASLEIRDANLHAEARKIVKKIRDLEHTLVTIDVEQLYGEEQLWMAIDGLIDSLERTLKRADKRRKP